MNKKNYFILLALSLISYTGISQKQLPAENNVDETLKINDFLLQRPVLDKGGVVKIAYFRTDSAPQLLSNAQAILRQLLPIKKDDELREMEIIPDSSNFITQGYEQYYKGIPVQGGVYNVWARDGVILSAYGTFHPVGEVDVTPRITEDQSIQCAMKHIGAELYAWQDSLTEAQAYEHWGISYYPQPQLIIAEKQLKIGKNYRLAYTFKVHAKRPFSYDLVYVDAITGEVINMSTLICYCNNSTLPNNAQTWYSGTKQITADKFSTNPDKYRLREWKYGLVETKKGILNGNSLVEGEDFIDNDNIWTSAEHGNNRVALDVHWAAEKILDYFAAKHYRYGWDGKYNSSKLLCLVETTSPGWDNARWVDGTAMFGFGNTTHNPVVALDVVAHEIGHGITFSATKIDYSRESGSLWEALADIWAACVEYWVTGNFTNAWQIGESVRKGKPNIRNMANPKLSGHKSQPDTYYGVNWDYTYSDIHTNNGIINRWFYLLSQGGSGINDFGVSYSVTGIDIDNAAKIVYKAITLTPPPMNQVNINFSLFREKTIAAVNALLNTSVPSHSLTSVLEAWKAVGVPAPAYLTSQYNGLCSSLGYSSYVYLDGLPPGFNNSAISWAPSDNVQLTNYGDWCQVTAKSGVTGGTATVVAKTNGIAVDTILLKIGTPISTSNTNHYIYPCRYQSYTLTPPKPAGEVYTFKWDWASGGSSAFSMNNWSGDNTTIVPLSLGTYTLYAYLKTDCGWSSSPAHTYTISVQNCSSPAPPPSPGGQGYSIFPNPTENSLTVSIDAQERAAYYEALWQAEEEEAAQAAAAGFSGSVSLSRTTKTPVYDIRLYDTYGNLLYQSASDGETVTFNVPTLPMGTYFLHIYDGIGETPVMQAIIKE